MAETPVLAGDSIWSCGGLEVRKLLFIMTWSLQQFCQQLWHLVHWRQTIVLSCLYNIFFLILCLIGILGSGKEKNWFRISLRNSFILFLEGLRSNHWLPLTVMFSRIHTIEFWDKRHKIDGQFLIVRFQYFTVDEVKLHFQRMQWHELIPSSQILFDCRG